MIDELKKDVEKLTGKIIEWRRDFHRHPEIAYEEKRTSSVIRQFLESLDIPVAACAKTGLRGVLEGMSGGKTVALRADIDALPLKEEGDREYISENPEAAHACGHDGHMAILMGVAELLSQKKDQFKGKVVFLFQPSEERIPGGAKRMIEEGALEGVDAVFGLHLWQPLPTGSVGIVKGAMMAQPDAFTITVKGKGGHGSMPHTTVDPILVASHLVVNIQSIVSRNVDPLKPVVVSFGTVKGGTIYNIIPSEVSLTGTVRTFDSSIQSLVKIWSISLYRWPGKPWVKPGFNRSSLLWGVRILPIFSRRFPVPFYFLEWETGWNFHITILLSTWMRKLCRRVLSLWPALLWSIWRLLNKKT
jgi:amidohydrolase